MRKLTVTFREFDGFLQALSRQAEVFENETGLPVELCPVPFEEFAETLLGDGDAQGADVLLVLSDWLPDLLHEDTIAPITERIHSAPPEGWPHAWEPSMLVQHEIAGEVAALPYHDGPVVLLYRKDLFEDGDEKRSYETATGKSLTPPTTWEEFAQVADHFARSPNSEAGCVIAAYPDGHNNVYDFLIQLWSRGGELFDESGRPAFHKSPGIEALEFLEGLLAQNRCQAAALEHDSVRAGEFFAQGHGAMMWNWSGFASLPGPISDRVAAAPMPSGGSPSGRPVSLAVYWSLALSASSPHAETAYAFMRHCASNEMDRLTSLSGAIGVRRSTWSDAEILRSYPHHGVIPDAHAHAHHLPKVANWPHIAETLSTAIYSTEKGNRSARQSLADAAHLLDGGPEDER